METEFIAPTRGGQKAFFNRVPVCHEVCSEEGQPPFVLLGYIRKDEPELWTANGAWLEDATPHPHDLIWK